MAVWKSPHPVKQLCCAMGQPRLCQLLHSIVVHTELVSSHPAVNLHFTVCGLRPAKRFRVWPGASHLCWRSITWGIDTSVSKPSSQPCGLRTSAHAFTGS